MMRIMTIPIAIWICMVSFLCLGCSASRANVQVPVPTEHVLTGGLVKSGYAIADSLVTHSNVPIGANDTILVASFVNINNLKESSTLGRMLSEHVASRLAQHGYKVIDMRLITKSVFMQEGKGEFLLSRDLREVSKNQCRRCRSRYIRGSIIRNIYFCAYHKSCR